MTTRAVVEVGPVVDEAELTAFAVILGHAFDDDPRATPDITWMKELGIENFWVARVRGRVAGGAGLISMGQWFGGKSVPMVGLGGVAVAPEHRSTGVGSQLMRSVLDELQAQGVPLTTLYPSTQAFYRRFGYEQAGLAVRYKLPLHTLPTGGHTLTVRSLDETEEPIIHDLYRRRAQQSSGNLDRTPWFWKRRLRENGLVNWYVAERDGVPEGYLAYVQRKVPGETERNLQSRDLVALTPEAGRALLSFLAGHRAVTDNLVWTGSANEPLFLHLANQPYTVLHYEQWLLRLVDVRAALEARGYPAGLSAEVHLAISDDVLPWNAGRFVVTVSEGRAKVSPGGEGRIMLDVRSLAPIYTGYLSPFDVRGVGAVDGADADLATLGFIFAGPTPWMADHF